MPASCSIVSAEDWHHALLLRRRTAHAAHCRPAAGQATAIGAPQFLSNGADASFE